MISICDISFLARNMATSFKGRRLTNTGCVFVGQTTPIILANKQSFDET